MTGAVSGTVSPGFERVGEAFASTLAGRAGASLCVYLGGKPIIDLWGGTADARTGAPWDESTLSVIFSCTKGLMSILAARLVGDGRLSYDDRVSDWWPEFAAAGKGDVRVRHLLSHQAGLSAPRVSLTIEDIIDWDRVAGVLAAQEPLWPLGSGYAYHAITHGWLIGEVVRRVTGKSVSTAFNEMIAAPLGASAWIGLPKVQRPRMARMQAAPEPDPPPPPLGGPDDWLTLAMTLGTALPPSLVGPDSGFNDPRIWSAEIPGAGGIASASALARIWSATVCETGGVRLLNPETVAIATVTQSSGVPVFAVPPPWSRWGMGFQLDSESRRYLTADGFGHDGAGGQVAFAEPGLGLGFAYLTNLMAGAGDSRATSIIDALRETLAPARVVAGQGAATTQN